MRIQKLSIWIAVTLALFSGVQALATMVRQMNLGEMTTNAERIIHGTIIGIEIGTVSAGGSELPTIKYLVRVKEVLKGSASTDAENLTEITMFGSLKAATFDREFMRTASVFEGPNLKSGQDYLLFLTAPSRVGLSTTVGVGQGAFHFLKEGTVMNEAKNAGLFRDMDRQGLPDRGPIEYSALADRIQRLLGN